MRVEGLISRKSIMRWLDEYEYMATGTRNPEAPEGSGGTKPADGISGTQLNKIMLDEAMETLTPLVRACLRSKYVYRLTNKQGTKALGIGASVYARRCEQGIDALYYKVNGQAANIADLLAKVEKA